MNRLVPVLAGPKELPRFARCVLLSLFTGVLVSSLNAQTGQPAPADTGKLPPARQLIERHIQAIGGREEIVRHHSSHWHGRLTIQKQSAVVNIYRAKPDYFLLNIDIPKGGQSVHGFNGEIGWRQDPGTSAYKLKGRMLEEIRLRSDFFYELRNPELFDSAETVSRAVFEGNEVYAVKMVSKTGHEMTEYYDAKNGFRTGSVETRENPQGVVDVITVLSEYKSFGNIKFATRMVQRINQQELVWRIINVAYNGVDLKTFKPPDNLAEKRRP